MDHEAETHHAHAGHEKKMSAFSSFSPVQMFVGGIAAGLLVLCTIGFFILLSITMKGGKLSLSGDAPITAPIVAAPAPAGNQGPNLTTPTKLAVAPVDESTDHILGDKNAKITLIEYSDLQCPICNRFEPTMKQVMETFKGKVRRVYRHYPLESIHPQALPAALASECANEQGKFWEFVDQTFTNQATMGDVFYKDLAKKLGLSQSKFNSCLDSKKYASFVSAQQQAGDSAGVGGTPNTFVVGPNGEGFFINAAYPYPTFEAAINKLLGA